MTAGSDQARNNMDDLRKKLASLRLDDEPPRSRRGAWLILARAPNSWSSHNLEHEDLAMMANVEVV